MFHNFTLNPRRVAVSLAAVGILASGLGIAAVTSSQTTALRATTPPTPTTALTPRPASNVSEQLGVALDKPPQERPNLDSGSPTTPGDTNDEFVDTEPIEGTPGVVTGNDSVATDPPPSPPVMQVAHLVAVPKLPPAPPAVNPIDILKVGGNGPAVPAVIVTDFQVPVDNSIGDLAPNVTGCALQCVTKAILTPNVTTPNVELDVEATVPARIDITLTNSDNGSESLFTSNGFKTKWSTTLTPLAPDTEYDLVLEAFDQEGQRRLHMHTFTTRAPLAAPDQFQDNQPGCAGSCITQAAVSPTDRPDEVRLDINTNINASVKVWMSRSEPGWIDGTPFLPADARVEPTLGIRKDWSVEKAFLDLDTRYHVIVRAEDQNGGVDYQVGDFTTGPAPPVNVRLTFELIFVQWDGDPHWGGLDRGELSFAWGLYDGHIDWEDEVGYRSEEKMDGGTTVVLSSDNEVWQTLDEDDVFLSPGVTAFERDNPPGVEFGGPIVRLRERPVSHGSSGRANPAWGPSLTLDEIKAQQTCGEMGVDQALPDDYCVSFETQDHDDLEYPNIQVIVSYHLDY